MVLYSNLGEVQLLVDTFYRVWEAGGQASLSTSTRDGKVFAKLDIELGSPSASGIELPSSQPSSPPKVRSQATAGHPAAASSRRRRRRHRGPAAKARARARAAAHQATLAAAAQAVLAPVATPGATSLPSVTSTAPPAKGAEVATPFDGDQEVICDECSGPTSLDARCLKPRKCTTDCGLNHWHKQFPGDDFAWAFSHEDGSDVLHCLTFCPRPDGCPCCGPSWTV